MPTSPPPDSLYVKLPLPPEVVRALRKHIDVGAELARMLLGAHRDARAIADKLTTAARELDQDVTRAHRALSKRKRRRK